MNTKKCLIGFIGLSRTFEKTYKNILEKIINYNNNFEFTIVANTDEEQLLRSKWRNKKINKLDKDLFKKKFKTFYKNVKYIIYYNLDDKNINGTKIFEKRINMIMEKEKEKYDLYLFLRFDIIINKFIDLNEFLPNKYKYKFTIIPGKNKINHWNEKRDDHPIDWDYCWIGDYKGINYWLNYKINNIKIINKNNFLELSKNFNGFRGKYYKKIVNNGKLNKKHWVNKLWEKIYNLYENNCEVKFYDKDDTFFFIIR